MNQTDLEKKDILENGGDNSANSDVLENKSLDEKLQTISNEITGVKEEIKGMKEEIVILSTKKDSEQVSADVIGNVENWVQNAKAQPLWTTHEGFTKSVDDLRNQYERLNYELQRKVASTKASRESLDNTKKKLKAWSNKLENIKNSKDSRKERAEKWDKKNNKKVEKLKKKYPDKEHPEYSEAIFEINEIDLGNFLAAYRQFEPLNRDLSRIEGGSFAEEAQFPNNSVEQVKRSIKENRIYYKKQLELNKALEDATILDIHNNKEKTKRDLLTDILEGRMDEEHKELYDQIFKSLGQNIANYPFLSAGMLACKWIKVNRKGQIETNPQGIPVSPMMAAVPWTVVYGNTPTRPGSYENLEWWETFNAGGLKGMLRKSFDYFPNLTNSQKDGWSSLIYAWGLIFGAVKWVQRLFKGKGKWRQKGLGIWGAILGSQIIFGKDPITLISQVLNGGFSWDQIKRKAGNSFSLLQREEPEIYQEVTDRGLAAGVRGGTKLRNFTTQINGYKNNQADWTNFYQSTLQTLSGKNNVKPVADAFKQLWPDFDEKKFKAFMDRIGVGLPVIHEHLQDKTMKQIFDIKEVNLNKLNLAGKNYQIKKDKLEEVNTLLLEENFNPETMFETFLGEGLIEGVNDTVVPPSKEKQDKEDFENQVKELELDEKKSKFLIDGFNGMYNEMKADHKPQFELIPDENGLYLVNKWVKVLINLDKKTIPGFRNASGGNSQDIEFDSAKNLLKTAYTAAAILKAFENKTSHNENPFQFKAVMKGIYFDDKKLNERGIDTRALSTGLWWGSKKVSPQVDNHSQQYAEYLNILWKERWGQPSASESVSNTSFENLEDKGNTKSQVEQLIFLSDSEKLELQRALNGIWTNISNSELNKNLSVLSVSETEFGSYEQKTDINLKERYIQNLSTNEWDKIVFSTRKELIETANFLNLMKYKTKDMKPSKSQLPFYMNSGRIRFRTEDGKETLSGSTLDIITKLFNSSIIQKNKSDIINYLNRWIEEK